MEKQDMANPVMDIKKEAIPLGFTTFRESGDRTLSVMIIVGKVLTLDLEV